MISVEACKANKDVTLKSILKSKDKTKRRRNLTSEEATAGNLSADIVSLPRLVTSRSHEKLSDDSRLTSKQSVKLVVVELAMHKIGRDIAPASKDDVSKLDKFLNVDD